jgi:hypothetical protein
VREHLVAAGVDAGRLSLEPGAPTEGLVGEAVLEVHILP